MTIPGIRFRVYKHKLIGNDGSLFVKPMIVLEDNDGMSTFTDFHCFVEPVGKVVPLNQTRASRFSFIVQLLNYAFFTEGICKLDDLTVQIVNNFLNAFGLCKLPTDNENTHRNKETVERCVRYVLDFLDNLIRQRADRCKIQSHELYKTVTKRDKRGAVIYVKVPLFDVKYISSYRDPIFRDIPNSVFAIIFNHFKYYHTNLFALVFLSAFSGLRPAEACNVVRMDSPLRPGILVDAVDGEIIKVKIDISVEQNLRSDLVSVGRIKSERKQQVPDIFLNMFYDSYNFYMDYLKDRPYEIAYAPLTINNRGKAMTYECYRQQFRRIIREEIVPILLENNNPEVVIYGRTLMEHSLSPHVFRHWYTVQLVLSGVSDPGTLMFWRGDKSPESALTYLQNKSELERLYSRVADHTFEYLQWSADLHGGVARP